MRVCYLIQSHKNPEQIYRLVRTIKTSCPDSFIVLSHDFSGSDLDVARLKDLSGIEVIPGVGGRGDFSIVQGYLDAIGWLLRQNISFDWLINLSGQDYPTQPLSQIKKFLAETHYDGFLEYFKVFSDESHWTLREGYTRYLYQYRKLKSLSQLPEWLKELSTPVKIINYIQPYFRLNLAYGMVGVRSTAPFDENFICYGGSFFGTLSRKCVEYLYDFYQCHPSVVSYYRGVSVSDESFIQTVLVNSRLFNLCDDNKFYFDFSGTRNGRPRLLTTNDYVSIVQSHAHFARKFDVSKDSKILDLFDGKIFANQDESLQVSSSQERLGVK
ncbi:MAG: beta-1,6-N-acetylglucosaminyltransferase [Scytonema sp. PMC 1069.18]|nr:beta-1,6-N-acetylglucosaminyltransferase [Scytonema sp. PMC 1069.18]MEC4879942.1 beta-1,6-N-acetylglucosaminyltransferase [Scytonema sp. PMC 1070.18]